MSFDLPRSDEHKVTQELIDMAEDLVDKMPLADVRMAAINAIVMDLTYNDGQSVLEYIDCDEELENEDGELELKDELEKVN